VAIVNSVYKGVLILNRHGRVNFANSAAVHLLRQPASNLIGKRTHELLHGAVPAGHACDANCPLRWESGEKIQSVSEEIEVFRADGSSFFSEYVLSPIWGEEGISGYLVILHDISARLAHEKARKEFLSSVSHELRTPLTAIRGALGLLSSGKFGETHAETSQLFRIAISNTDRLMRIVNDILDLERLKDGKALFDFHPVSLDEIVRQAIDNMLPVAEAAEVQLRHEVTPVEIVADPHRLHQVLANLLSNAIKFSPAGTTVTLRLRTSENGVTLSTIDQGRGIPAEKLEEIFGRFHQVQTSDSKEKGGTGLGLAICRTIVQYHSGRIWAECNSDCGSTFHVFLPFCPDGIETPPANHPPDNP
jgi:PAS domain S-box-containing protein